jgi:putative heme-binding domain-containing protein
MRRSLCFLVGFSLAVSVTAPVEAQKKENLKPFGIAKRVPWTTSKMVGSPEPPVPYLVERAFPKLQFKNPVEMVAVPGTDQLAILELDGKLQIFRNVAEATSLHVAADVTTLEGVTRAYGVAFHPDFEKNKEVFLCFITEAGLEDGSRVSRFRATSVDPLTIDLTKEEVVVTWPAGGHNGGSIQFGPHDGMLYITTGDSGPAFPPDPKMTGQDVGDLLASVLRINVDEPAGDLAYSIPNDNPFVDLKGARGEVWSYGHRNPWRMSFDPETNDLWVGDVGWELWEMIYRVKPGDNYGWSIIEHTQAVHPERPHGPTPVVPPAVAHSHTESRSITGGYVYRGERLKDLAGTYVYGDYVTGKLWGVTVKDEVVSPPREIANSSIQVICFGVDHQNELYVVGYDGTLNRLVPNPERDTSRQFPRRLSESGLLASAADHTLAPGVIPYSINAEPWADGTLATRFIALPGESTVGVHTENNVQKGNLKGHWNYPDGTVIGKTISIDLDAGDAEKIVRLETQILHRHAGGWLSYSYTWNEDQTDATLAGVPGFDKTFSISDADAPGGIRKQTWHYAGRTECLLCHTTRGGSVYGFNIGQLNRDFDYGSASDNQLRTLAHIGVFEEPLAVGAEPTEAPLDKLAKTTDPSDFGAELMSRARSYLHVNCAHCHRRGGGGTAAIEVPLEIEIGKSNLVSRPTQGTFGLADSWVVSPGDPYSSTLYYRVAKVGRGRMPHFGSQVVDEGGIRLIHDWIKQLSADPAGPDIREATPDEKAAARKLKTANESSLLLLTGGLGVKSSLQDAAIDRLLSSTQGALMLSSFMRGFGRDLSLAIQKNAIARGVAHPDPQVRDLFEPFIPEEKRVRRLGNTINAAEILVLRGDAARGRNFYLKAPGVQCRNCHQTGSEGKELGPKFDGIGKRLSRAEILVNILEPSKKVDEKYRTWLVETVTGKVYSGLLDSKTDKEVRLRDALGKEIVIPADQVDLLLEQRKSIMPELQLKDMTVQEVADLLAFLESLK